MKKIVLIVLCVLLIMPTIGLKTSAVSARSAVVICADTGEIVYSHNCDERLPMASTTKIMTGLLLCETGNLSRSIVVTDEMVRVEGSSMGLLPGDTVTLHDLLYGLLLASGNDAANTIAITLGGSVEKFADMMNNRAEKLGLKDTHFVTPSGLDADEHYTTAYELALIAKEALKNEYFAAAVSSKSQVLYYGNPPYRRTITNHNKLLKNYEGAVGVKTGFTKKSGRCLVSAAKKDGKFLIAVTLNDPNDWADHKMLLDDGFSKIETHNIKPDLSSVVIEPIGGNNDIQVETSDFDISAIKTKQISYDIIFPQFIYAPIAAGEKVGEVRCYVDEKIVSINSITSKFDVKELIKDKKTAFLRLFKYIISFV